MHNWHTGQVWTGHSQVTKSQWPWNTAGALKGEAQGGGFLGPSTQPPPLCLLLFYTKGISFTGSANPGKRPLPTPLGTGWSQLRAFQPLPTGILPFLPHTRAPREGSLQCGDVFPRLTRSPPRQSSLPSKMGQAYLQPGPRSKKHPPIQPSIPHCPHPVSCPRQEHSDQLPQPAACK